MEQYINKSAVVAEIEKRRSRNSRNKLNLAAAFEDNYLLSFIDTLEVKGIDSWHSQEKENIYDAVKDWSSQTFVCIMKDGSIQKFIGNLDEDYEGHINAHIYGANDDYDNVDDIVKWIEST